MNNQIPKWVPIVTRRITVFRTFITAQGSRDEVKRYLGHGCDYLAITKDEQCSVYLAAADTKRVSEIILEKIKENPQFPSLHAEDCRQGCAALVAISQESAKNIEGQAGEVLKEKFLRYCQEYIRFAKFMAIPVAIERMLTARITAAITERVGAERTPEYLKKLLTPPALSEFQKEPLGLLRLAINKSPEKLAAHASEFCWLSCYNIDEEAYTDNYFKGRYEELIKTDQVELKKQLASLEGQLAHDDKVFHAALAELNLAADMQKEIELLREYVYLRTFRVEMQSKSNFYIQPLFKALAEHLRLTLRQVAALKPEEIAEAIEDAATLPPAEGLEVRGRDYGFRYDAQGMIFVTGDQVRALAEKELGVADTATALELRGTPAYQGSTQGTVRVVLSKDEIRNFLEGEILVTTMTTPEFVPVMKKAKAIVTNEGGVLCHAAIVARELKIPCIIGTERATSVFKTGDQIMVDATNGLVKKV